MKSKELIQLLQKADPTGELEVFVDNADIDIVYKEEMSWNGKPQLLIRDKNIQSSNVIGGKICVNGQKVTIRILPLSDLLYFRPELPVDISEIPDRDKPTWETWIKKWRKGEEA